MPPAAAGIRATESGPEPGELEDPHRRTARSDHGYGLGEVQVLRYLVQAVDVGDGEFGVASGREAEVGDDPPAEPVRGRRRRRGPRRCRRPHGRGWWAAGWGRARGPGARAQGGVEEVDSGRGDGDTDLARGPAGDPRSARR